MLSERIDGRAKTTGGARYAADHDVGDDMLHAWIVEATVGSGQVEHIDADEAKGLPGVVAVIAVGEAPDQRPYGEPEDAGRFGMSHALLRDAEIRYHGQPVAVVVAETLEQARDAAQRIGVRYAAKEARFALGDHADELEVPDELDGGLDPDVERGDLDAILAEADVVVDERYTTPAQISAAMEPHATIARWDGEILDVYVAIQIVDSAVDALANTFCLEREQVRVRAPYVGGGFGSKLGIHSDAVLASIAAIELQRPVRLVQTRRNVFHNGPHRGESRQRLRLGASAEGELLAVSQECEAPMVSEYPFAEPIGGTARVAYRCRALRSTHRVVPVARPPVDSMRAPGEAIGTWALEAAMDELAVALQLDPVELRLRNLPEVEPGSGKPFARFDLGRCLREGAEAFGWSERPAAGTREGRWRVGWGVSAATRINMMEAAACRAELHPDGRVVVASDMTDIGNGSYTLFAQLAVDALGVDVGQVDVQLADSALPASSGSGGSFGSASSGGAAAAALENLKEAVLTWVRTHRPDLAGSGSLALEDGAVVGQERVLLADLGLDAPLVVDGEVEPSDAFDELAQHAYGAHFVELRVDGASGEVRLRRVLGVFDIGRVLNPTLARSQLLGGITYGVGGALTEHLEMDARYGQFVNRDLAEYHLPVHRDIPDVQVQFVGDEPVDGAGPFGSKGVGELSLCGIAGAISNAVWHATGVRVRDLPITPDKVLAGLVD